MDAPNYPWYQAVVGEGIEQGDLFEQLQTTLTDISSPCCKRR